MKIGCDRSLPLLLRSAIMSDSPGHGPINKFFTGVGMGGGGDQEKSSDNFNLFQHFPVR